MSTRTRSLRRPLELALLVLVAFLLLTLVARAIGHRAAAAPLLFLAQAAALATAFAAKAWRRPDVAAALGFALYAGEVFLLALGHPSGALPLGPLGGDVHGLSGPVLAATAVAGVASLGVAAGPSVLGSVPLAPAAAAALPATAALGWLATRDTVGGGGVAAVLAVGVAVACAPVGVAVLTIAAYRFCCGRPHPLARDAAVLVALAVAVAFGFTVVAANLGAAWALESVHESWTVTRWAARARVPAAPGRLEVVDRRPAERRPRVGAVALVVDASGSMNDGLGGGRADFGKPAKGPTKMDAARAAVSRLLRALPDRTPVALRAYGFTKQKPGLSKLLAPLAPLDRGALEAAVARLEPCGWTPIAASLDLVPGDLAAVGSGAGQRVCLLVSDGIENTGGDPVASARRLGALGIRVDVVGLGLGPDDGAATKQLSEAAAASGGRYGAADDAQALDHALLRSIAEEYRVERAGVVVARGAVGAPVSLAPGRYRVVVESSSRPALDVVIRSRATTHVELSSEASLVPTP